MSEFLKRILNHIAVCRCLLNCVSCFKLLKLKRKIPFNVYWVIVTTTLLATSSFSFEHPYDYQQYVGTPNLPLETPVEDPEQLKQLVSLSDGNMHLGIPLAEVDVGNKMTYTIILGYNAGIKQNQQATSVGLGWTINPGAIIRTVRGYADDRKGQIIGTIGMGGMQSNTMNSNFDLVPSPSLPSETMIYRNEENGQVEYVDFNSGRQPGSSITVFNGEWGLSLGGGSIRLLHSTRASPLTFSYQMSRTMFGLNIYGTSMKTYGIMYRGLESNNGLPEQEANLTEVLGIHRDANDNPIEIHRRYKQYLENTETHYMFSRHLYHDNYSIQGPAPSGLLFWDDTRQIDANGNPSNNPSQTGFYYVNRNSLNSSYAPDKENEIQGIKVYHSIDENGFIKGFKIVDINGIQYYYYKCIRIKLLVDKASKWSDMQLPYTGRTIDDMGRNTAWLLTAIVYPDFLDGGNSFDGTNNQFLMDPEDKGSYVAFSYTDPYTDFGFQDPEYDNQTQDPYKATPPQIIGGGADNFRYSQSCTIKKLITG